MHKQFYSRMKNLCAEFMNEIILVAQRTLTDICNTPSVRKYLSSKWTKRDVYKTKIHLDTSPFIHFDDKYFRTEGVVRKGK